MSQTVTIRDSDVALAREFVRRLTAKAGERISQVTLYGSRARGDADEESDLDLFVTVKGDEHREKVEKQALGIACEMTLESGTLVSVLVADGAFLQRHQGFAFLEAIEEEGILLRPKRN